MHAAEGAVNKDWKATGAAGGLTTGIWLFWWKLPRQPYWLTFMTFLNPWREGREVRISELQKLMLGMN